MQNKITLPTAKSSADEWMSNNKDADDSRRTGFMAGWDAASSRPAKTILAYMEQYKEHLQDNNLADDSKDITIGALIDFVENEIDSSESN